MARGADRHRAPLGGSLLQLLAQPGDEVGLLVGAHHPMARHRRRAQSARVVEDDAGLARARKGSAASSARSAPPLIRLRRVMRPLALPTIPSPDRHSAHATPRKAWRAATHSRWGAGAQVSQNALRPPREMVNDTPEGCQARCSAISESAASRWRIRGILCVLSATYKIGAASREWRRRAASQISPSTDNTR